MITLACCSRRDCGPLLRDSYLRVCLSLSFLSLCVYVVHTHAARARDVRGCARRSGLYLRSGCLVLRTSRGAVRARRRRIDIDRGGKKERGRDGERAQQTDTSARGKTRKRARGEVCAHGLRAASGGVAGQ